MVQQGRILAAALGDRGPIDALRATMILQRLERRLNARLRVVDREGWVIADSSAIGPRLPDEALAETASGSPEASPADASRRNVLYRLGSGIYNLYRRVLGAPEGTPAVEPFPADKPLDIEPVRRALSGKYGALTLISPGQRSVTLYSAIPVRSGRQVVGAVLVSGTTLRILGDLYQVRLAVFQVVLASMLAAVLLTVVASTTIVRPLGRLRSEALALIDGRGRLRGTFGGSQRTDEIGDLARALEELSRRLVEHLAFVEAFAGDVSHELKNPLASIRGAAEMLEESKDPAERRQLLDLVQREVARLEHLLKEVREMARLDAQVEGEARPTVELEALLPALVEGVRRRAPAGVAVELELAHSTIAGPRGLTVRAAPERLAQVVENLLDNALSFAPEGSAVTVRLERAGPRARLSVRDRGPGIPDSHLDRVWSRFFSYRPAGAGDGKPHTGLGLAIVKAIVEGYGGTVSAANAADGGAVFEVTLPLAG
jgi:two-component system sensor histidine kinase ChvG